MFEVNARMVCYVDEIAGGLRRLRSSVWALPLSGVELRGNYVQHPQNRDCGPEN
jgi:hypothetical protein